MKPLRVTRKLLDVEFQRAEIQRISARIASAVQPLAIYVFGSAADLQASDQSDFDFLIVLDDSQSVGAARAALRKEMPLSKFPVDIIWKRKTEFIEKRAVGGISLVAWEDGFTTYNSGITELENDQKKKI